MNIAHADNVRTAILERCAASTLRPRLVDTRGTAAVRRHRCAGVGEGITGGVAGRGVARGRLRTGGWTAGAVDDSAMR